MPPDEYGEQQSALYPPDGYYTKTSKAKREDGKRGEVTVPNRDFSPAYQNDYKSYDNAKSAAKIADMVHQSERDRYREAEAKNGVYDMYNGIKALKCRRIEVVSTNQSIVTFCVNLQTGGRKQLMSEKSGLPIVLFSCRSCPSCRPYSFYWFSGLCCLRSNCFTKLPL